MLPYIITALVAALVGVGIAFPLGVKHRKKIAEQKIGSAEAEAMKIINDAIKTAEQKRKESALEAKDEMFRIRSEADREIKERRSELNRQERRLDQKEENLERKTQSLEKSEENLKKRAELTEAKLAEAEQLRAQQTEKLESIAALTQAEAREMLLTRLDGELTHEKAVRIAAYEAQTREEAEGLAREMISQALARCAADHTGEATVSVVPLPNDEMKGRIIGREGRNIRALETATGVDLIIDDTPEAITLSCFDLYRREVARQALEKLISDGSIHPARIEETVEKCRRELDASIKREGERVVMELGIHGIHPDLIKLLGRLRYRTSYGQNVLEHSIEVAYLSGVLASELGVNVGQARRAGLLHDIGKSIDRDMEGTHVSIGVDLCRKYKENPAIIHAVEAHHNDVEPTSTLAFIVMAADAISASRPGARRENLENYIKRLERLEEIASSFPGVETSYAIQAGREVRILVKPEAVSDDELVILARDIVLKIEAELDYPGQIKVNVIRENRAVDFAK